MLSYYNVQAGINPPQTWLNGLDDLPQLARDSSLCLSSSRDPCPCRRTNPSLFTSLSLPLSLFLSCGSTFSFPILRLPLSSPSLYQTHQNSCPHQNTSDLLLPLRAHTARPTSHPIPARLVPSRPGIEMERISSQTSQIQMTVLIGIQTLLENENSRTDLSRLSRGTKTVMSVKLRLNRVSNIAGKRLLLGRRRGKRKR